MREREMAIERVFLLIMLFVAGALLMVLGRQMEPVGPAPAWAYRDVVIGPHREPHGLYRRIGGNTYQQTFEHRWLYAGVEFVNSPPPAPAMLHTRELEGGALEERLSIHHGDYIYQVCWIAGALSDCGYFVEAWAFGWPGLPVAVDELHNWQPEVLER